MNSDHPSVSVIVCTFNGAKRISDCLKSLNAQSYPKNRYEVIVVDDGSTDTTSEVARQYTEYVIRHDGNRGISFARNTGLNASNGELVAYIDDDCIAEPHWLERLAGAFNDPDVVAAGGQIVAYKKDFLAERYQSATGYGNPIPVGYGKSQKPLKRFFAYIKHMFRPVVFVTQPTEVEAVFTANAAYRASTLVALGGFDETLFSAEDSDISSRLRKDKEHVIMYIPDAVVYHRHTERLSEVISKTFYRAENTYHYYRKEKKVLPIFPLPFLYLLIAGALFVANYVAGILFIIFGPFLLYMWWIPRLLRENSYEYATYGYIQLLLESVSVLGLVRGCYRDTSDSDVIVSNTVSEVRTSQITVREICLIAIVWTAVITGMLFGKNISPWIATPIDLVGMLFVPGVLSAIVLKIKVKNGLEYMLYALSIGLAFLIIGGLAINWALPHLGVSQPLAKVPLIVSFDSAVAVLALWAYVFNKNLTIGWERARVNKVSLIFGIIPFIFLLMSVIGAQRLNSLGTGTITVVMLFGIALYVIAVTYWSKSIQQWVYIAALYLISLSLLLMYALRSSHILGWDINGEYQVFQATLQNLVWKMSYFPKLDYNACVSITILPTIFQQFTNISSEYIFKVLYQLLFAVTPVMVYALSRRYITQNAAFLASFLLVAQTWFFEQMPALIRQETAFIFYAVILLALFDTELTKRTRYVLFYLFTVGLILSHYSTAYTWLTLMLGVLLLSYGTRLFSRSLRSELMVIKPTMFVISLALLFIWEVPVTHTAGAVASFASNSGEIVDSLTPSILQSELMKTLFVGNNPNTDQNVQLAQGQAINDYGRAAGYDTYPGGDAGYVAGAASDASTFLNPKLPQFLSAAINLLAQISKLLVIDLFPIIGMIVMYVGLRREKLTRKYDFILLNVGAYALIVIMLLVPYLQEYYNFTRLYLQMFLLLSTLAIIGGLAVMKYAPRYRMVILAVLAAVIFCSLSGAFDQLTGGQARITLNQPQATLDTYYIYDSEIAAAQWLAANRSSADPVQADVMANLRLQSFGNMTANNFAIFPQTIETNSYVYLIGVNTIDGDAFYKYGDNTLMYNYPLAFLNSHKNLIYDDGDSEIFK